MNCQSPSITVNNKFIHPDCASPNRVTVFAEDENNQRTIILDAFDSVDITNASFVVDNLDNVSDAPIISQEGEITDSELGSEQANSSNPQFYGYYDSSPFKKYLKIGENVLSNKKRH